jgi:hypothetical protein
MSVNIRRQGGVGESVKRIDGVPKVKGEFEYASDLHRDGMLWGATLRSPYRPNYLDRYFGRCRRAGRRRGADAR